MFITGYHGTTKKNAEHILSTRKFYLSKGEKEWLGSGIYFYPNLNDAYEWRESEVILHAVIRIKSSEYLDLDRESGLEAYRNAYNFMFKYTSEDIDYKDIDRSYKHSQENQCAVINAMWALYSDIKVISASFPTEMTFVPTMIDVRPRRKEFCVRDNRSIVTVHILERGELNGRFSEDDKDYAAET